MTLLLEFNMQRVNNRQAMVGVSAPQSQRAASVEDLLADEKIRCLSPADGRRGRQEFNGVSGKFIFFINMSFQF
jgi:hypothetical protein